MGWGEERDCHRSPDDSLWLPGCVQELVLLGGQAQGVAGVGTGEIECFSFCYVLFPTSSSWASWLFNSCCEWTLLPSGGSWFGRHAAASAWTQMARCLKTQACVDGKNKRYWQIFLSPIIGDKRFCSSLKIEYSRPCFALCPPQSYILVHQNCLLSQGPSWGYWSSPLWHLLIFPYFLSFQPQPTLRSTSTGFSWEDFEDKHLYTESILVIWIPKVCTPMAGLAVIQQVLYCKWCSGNPGISAQGTDPGCQIGKRKVHYYIHGLCYDFHYSIHYMYVWIIKNASYH